jgi:hypothetical protein
VIKPLKVNITLMRIVIAICALVVCTDVFGQVIYDRNIVKQYDSLYKKFPSRTRKTFADYRNNKISNHGLAFITLVETDTLNVDDQDKVNSPEVILIDLDPKTGKPLKSRRKKFKKKEPFSINFCYGSLSNDTLIIQIGEPFWGQTILHLIAKNKVLTQYNEYIKRDTIFKATLFDTLTDNLTIPANTIRFSLNDSNFYSGKTVYGSVEVITNPYFKKDVWEENQYFELQQRFKYYFRVPLIGKEE